MDAAADNDQPACRPAHAETTFPRQAIEAALRDSEEKYRTVFDSIDEGFCVIEMIEGDHDAPIDYRFLEINAPDW